MRRLLRRRTAAVEDDSPFLRRKSSGFRARHRSGTAQACWPEPMRVYHRLRRDREDPLCGDGAVILDLRSRCAASRSGRPACQTYEMGGRLRCYGASGTLPHARHRDWRFPGTNPAGC